MIFSLFSLSLMLDDPVTVEKKPIAPTTKPILEGLIYINDTTWSVWIQNKEHTQKGSLDQNWYLEGATESEVLIKDSNGNLEKLSL